MATADEWNYPRNEDGLQALLGRLARARADGDPATEGRALLELAFLVKWVRSDNDQSPFERSHTLSLEALVIFRRIGDRSGQVSALISAAPFEPREHALQMLSEAQELADASGGDLDRARVLAVRARMSALSDAEHADALNREALALFRELGNAAGIANCLFSMAIRGGTSEEKRDYALEAAQKYREAGLRSDAGKAMVLAAMNAKRAGALAAIESQIQEGVKDAQDSEDRSTEGMLYGYLAEIAEANGDAEGVARYLRWKRDLSESDGLTANERWEQDVAMTKTMVAMAKRMENREMVRAFQGELRRLKAAKP